MLQYSNFYHNTINSSLHNSASCSILRAPLLLHTTLPLFASRGDIAEPHTFITQGTQDIRHYNCSTKRQQPRTPTSHQHADLQPPFPPYEQLRPSHASNPHFHHPKLQTFSMPFFNTALAPRNSPATQHVAYNFPALFLVTLPPA